MSDMAKDLRSAIDDVRERNAAQRLFWLGECADDFFRCDLDQAREEFFSKPAALKNFQDFK